jgi:hypothetical protein
VTEAVPSWFNNTLADGLTMLVALALPGTPPAETIALTLNVWVNALWPRQAWTEDDSQRLQAAFVYLAGTCDRWPTPRQLVQALPARPEVRQLEGPRLSPEKMAANKQRALDLLQAAREALLAGHQQPKEKA